MIFKNRRQQYKFQEFVTPFKRHDKDVGSASVQIARLSINISDLSKHLQVHKKDFHSLLGLKKMSSQRKKLLKFLHINNKQEYENVVSQLSLRHSKTH